MAEIVPGRYIGDLRGTLVGNLFVEVSDSNSAFEKKLVVRVGTGGGVNVLEGELAGETVGTVVELANEQGGNAKFLLERIDQTGFGGRWEDAAGNAGPFNLVRASTEIVAAEASTSATDAPLQTLQRTGTLPKLSLFRDDLLAWAETMKALLDTPYQVSIRSKMGGKEIRRLSADFWKIASLPDEVGEIHLWLGEPGDLSRSINISMSSNDSSFTVQGSNDVWVTGTFNELSEVLQRRQGRWRTFYEKHFLNVNALLLFIVIALSPSIDDLLSRFTFVFGALAVMLAISFAHRRTTRVRIYLKSEFKRTAYFDLPRFITTIAAAAALGAIGWAYAALASGQLKLLLQQMVGS